MNKLLASEAILSDDCAEFVFSSIRDEWGDGMLKAQTRRMWVGFFFGFGIACHRSMMYMAEDDSFVWVKGGWYIDRNTAWCFNNN